MKVYIAAPWKHRELLPTIAERFTAAGHTITEKWWDHKDVGQDQMEENREEMATQARADKQGVYNANTFIFLNLAYSEGKCVELGMALSEGMPIIAVGKPGMNVFHYLPNIRWVATVEDAIELLSKRT